MSIREDAKKIVRHCLEKVVASGDLDWGFDYTFNELAQTLSLKDVKYCRVCCQYLRKMGYINVDYGENDEGLKIWLSAAAVDFLETV